MNHTELDLRQLTDEELELLLQEDQDAEFLLEAAEEYAGRLVQKGIEMPAPEATWAAFAAAHLPPAHTSVQPIRPKRSIRRKLFLVAAVLAIGAALLMGTAYAIDFFLFDWIPEWRGDRFIILWDEPETQPDPRKVLEKYGITRTGTPDWVPEYYHLNRYIDGPVGGASVYYWGIAPGLEFSVIPYYKGMEVEHEDKGTAEVYRANGITYYIFTGFKSTEVIWMEDGCECSIFWGQSVTQTKKLLQAMRSFIK